MKAITLCKRKGELLMAELQKGLEGLSQQKLKLVQLLTVN